MLFISSTHATCCGHYGPSSDTKYMIFKTQNNIYIYTYNLWDLTKKVAYVHLHLYFWLTSIQVMPLYVFILSILLALFSSFRFPCTSAPRILYWPLRPSKTSMARTDWEISCTRTLLTQPITSRENMQPSLCHDSLRSIQVCIFVLSKATDRPFTHLCRALTLSIRCTSLHSPCFV